MEATEIAEKIHGEHEGHSAKADANFRKFTGIYLGIVAMLLNVFVPHVPATLVFHSYTPGVVTAVLINLPLMTWLALSSVREEWVSGVKALAFAVLVPLGLAGIIAALFAIGSRT